ncbi:neuromedin U receptor [Chamberlinius hualienensis]
MDMNDFASQSNGSYVNFSDEVYSVFKSVGSSPVTLASDFNLAKAIPMTIVYSLIFITGIFGNFCTCIIIARNKHMHTATNFYLFSLAMSDLLLLVLGLPQEMFQLWVPIPYMFGETFCIFRGLAAETSTNASILTITSFTMERYLAICHPLRAHTMSKLSRAVKLIVVIWIVAAACAVPQAIQFGVVLQRNDDGELMPHTEDCSLKMPLNHSFELSTLFFFLLPMTLITILYILIGVRLRDHVFRVPSSRETGSWRCNAESDTNHKKNGIMITVIPDRDTTSSRYKRSLKQENSDQRRHHSTNSRRAVVKMLVAVVVAFFVCWAPFHAQRLMAIYATSENEALVTVYEALTYVSGVLYYVSATVNPILYHIMSHKFRSAFRDTLGACCGHARNKRRRSSSLSNCHKHNSVYNYQSTVRSRGGTDNTETTLETLLREDIEIPLADSKVVNGQSSLSLKNGRTQQYRLKDCRTNSVVNHSASSSLSNSSSTNSNEINNLKVNDVVDSGMEGSVIEMEMNECIRLNLKNNVVAGADKHSISQKDFYFSHC